MNRSVIYWLRSAYRKNKPAMAQDASATTELRRAMRKLGRRWQARFDTLSVNLADYFATAVADRVDGALAKMLRDGGMTVRFRASGAQREAYQALKAENVTLIRSIAAQYLTQVEGLVMRSVMEGRDLGTLTRELEDRYGITRRRAALIARHQNNIGTATLLRARHVELGVTKARWLHSAGGKVPRPEHVAFSGKTYDIRKGAFLEGKWTWPGVEINCRCTSVPIIPGFDE
jgi:uncharacterized protein with gpF-like domain